MSVRCIEEHGADKGGINDKCYLTAVLKRRHAEDGQTTLSSRPYHIISYHTHRTAL